MKAPAIHRLVVIVLTVLVVGCSVNVQAAIPWKDVGQIGLGVVGGLVGAAAAVAAINEMTPEIESGFGSTAVVIGSVTVFDGLGAAAGVLAAGKIWDVDGDVGGCLLGGLAGGLASAFIEPVLYLVGIPESVTEFLGLTLLPVLPAIGAYLGFNWP